MNIYTMKTERKKSVSAMMQAEKRDVNINMMGKEI